MASFPTFLVHAKWQKSFILNFYAVEKLNDCWGYLWVNEENDGYGKHHVKSFQIQISSAYLESWDEYYENDNENKRKSKNQSCFQNVFFVKQRLLIFKQAVKIHKVVNSISSISKRSKYVWKEIWPFQVNRDRGRNNLSIVYKYSCWNWQITFISFSSVHENLHTDPY